MYVLEPAGTGCVQHGGSPSPLLTEINPLAFSTTKTLTHKCNKIRQGYTNLITIPYLIGGLVLLAKWLLTDEGQSTTPDILVEQGSKWVYILSMRWLLVS